MAACKYPVRFRLAMRRGFIWRKRSKPSGRPVIVVHPTLLRSRRTADQLAEMTGLHAETIRRRRKALDAG